MKNITIAGLILIIAIILITQTTPRPYMMTVVINDIYIETQTQLVVKTVKKVSLAEKLFVKEYVKGNYVIDKKELLALSTTLYCEARGESWLGLAAAADTIRNRVKSKMFPNTYYGVVTQRKQFSCVNNTTDLTTNAVIRNSVEATMYRKIIHLAKRTISGELGKITYNALFYHTDSVNPWWGEKYTKLGKIGNHIFYTTSRL